VYKKVLGRNICGLYQGIANGGLSVFILKMPGKKSAISLFRRFGCMMHAMRKRLKVKVKSALNRPRWSRGGGGV
jgi:hypothetical protein